MREELSLALLTLGDPAKLTGGYLYHRRLAAAAPRHGARVGFVSLPEHPFPLPLFSGRRALAEALAADPAALLVDSIVAAYLAPALLRSRPPRPLCAVLHQPPGGIGHGPLRAPLQAALDMLLYRRADLLVVASQMLAVDMETRGIAKGRLRVVPPGRDSGGEAPTEAPPTAMLSAVRPAFLCVANWLPHKGIHLLLDAFALLPPEAGVLHLVGDDRVDPAYAGRIAKRLAHPALAGRVHVHGPLSSPAVAACYRTADVFVLPAGKETYGTVYGEAMSAGLPVIGLCAGNLPYLVTSGVEGLLAAPGDAPGLAKALLTLAADEPLRRRLGAAARRRAASWPTWEESAAAFFTAIRDLVGRYCHYEPEGS